MSGVSEATAWWFALRGSELLVRLRDEQMEIPSGEDLAAAPLNRHQIGELDGRPCYAAELADDVEAPEGMAFQGLRAIYGKVDRALYQMAGRAVQIVEWDRTHRFCGRCGTPTLQKADENAKACPSCGMLFFPRLSPAIIVLIRDGERTLLARSHRFPPGRFSTIAGFVEPGETLEEAVQREAGEEVGVRLKNIRYFGSQPWPFPHSLMIGFTADYDGGEIRIQEEEIADARWFTVDELPDLPPPMSIARRLIDHYIDEMRRGPGGR
jgi:NAD+ diphosphatase